MKNIHKNNQLTGLSSAYGQKKHVACTYVPSISIPGCFLSSSFNNCFDIAKNSSKFILYLFPNKAPI
jgi:hypothetical protein